MAKKQDLAHKDENAEVKDVSAGEQELQSLRSRLAEIETRNKMLEEQAKIPRIDHLGEMRQMREQGKNDANVIKYKDIHDHRNIRLWHTNGREVGRSVGPIHPANAEETFQRFATKGVILSISRPSQESIDRYKSTEEYKSLMRIEEARRESKKTMSRENSVDKLTAAIAKLAGVPIENSIKPNAVVAR